MVDNRRKILEKSFKDNKKIIGRSADSDALRIPVIHEEIQVGKKIVDTGRGLRIEKKISEVRHVIEQPLEQDYLVVRHVAHDCFINENEIPETRYEGSTMIIPIIEEVLVWEKRLKLKEEIHVTRESRTVTSEEVVYLKADQISVERFDENDH